MAIVILFWASAWVCCVYAAIFGASTGRWGATFFLLTVLGTMLADRLGPGWSQTNYPLFVVDGIYLAALYALAVLSRRFWPIWSAGFQLLSVLTHVATLLDPFTPPQLYRALESFWALPILITMVIGVSLDRRAGLAYSTKEYSIDTVR